MMRKRWLGWAGAALIAVALFAVGVTAAAGAGPPERAFVPVDGEDGVSWACSESTLAARHRPRSLECAEG